jgi:hypothetical protein
MVGRRSVENFQKINSALLGNEMYARIGNILLSLLGPAYFGFVHSPYVVLAVWSAACAAIFFWSNRASLRHARQVAYGTYPVALPYMVFFTGLLYVACFIGLLGIYSVLYFIASSLAVIML